MGEQPHQQVPAPAPGPGNLPAVATAQPAQLTAEEKLEVNLKFKLFSYLQISSSSYPPSRQAWWWWLPLEVIKRLIVCAIVLDTASQTF